MDWAQFATFIITNTAFSLTLWFWQRSDLNHLASEAAADRRDILNLIRSIDQEMKDFHGRLCAIEEKRK